MTMISFPRNRQSFMLWWAYNFCQLTTAAYTAPFWVPLVGAVKRRRLTFGRRIGLACCRTFSTKRPVWVQALSVGEVRSVEPFVKRLSGLVPELLVTASTYSGHALARDLFPAIQVDYFPYDFVFSVRRAIRRWCPEAVVMVETEIWPNFLTELKRRRIAANLVNGRLSDRSFKRFVRFRKFAAWLFNHFDFIGVQGEDDACRFLELGVAPAKIMVTGNFKFDLDLEPVDPRSVQDVRRRWRLPAGKPLVVVGSSHAGEERLILDALEGLLARRKGPCLVVAPRDAGRAVQVAGIFKAAGFAVQTMGRRPLPRACQAQVVVLDKIGILRQVYALADLAIIGGSFVAAGGHNPLEPAALGCPVVFGPDMSDFRQIAALLRRNRAAIQVSDSADLRKTVTDLLHDRRSAWEIGTAGRTMVAANRGAVAKTLAALNIGPEHERRK